MATRCCSPADSWSGRWRSLPVRSTSSIDVADPLGSSPLRGSLAGDRERQADVLGDVEERDQVEELEDEAGPVAAQPGRRVVGQLADRLALEDDLAGVGRSSPPSSWRSVLLPEPDGPISATNSPASTVSETPRSASTVVSPSR